MKKEKKKNPVTILLMIAIILNIIDVVTAYKILPGEANPIYLLTGSYLSIVLAKVFIIGIIIWGYLMCFKTPSKRPSDKVLFIYTVYLVLFILALLFGIYTNVGATDVQIQTAADTKAAMSEQQISDYNNSMIVMYFKIMFIIMIYPALVGIISFYIWRKAFLMNNGILGEKH